MKNISYDRIKNGVKKLLKVVDIVGKTKFLSQTIRLGNKASLKNKKRCKQTIKKV